MTTIKLKVDDELMQALVDLYYKHIKGRGVIAEVEHAMTIKGAKKRFHHMFDTIVIELEPRYKRKIKRRKI